MDDYIILDDLKGSDYLVLGLDSYINKLSNDVNLVNYEFDEGTSPEKVTIPIAEKGINTLLMETSITDPLTQKHQTAVNLIKSLDELNA